MNRLIDAILNAKHLAIPDLMKQPNWEKMLLERWSDDHESALPLAFRLMNTPWEDSKNRKAWTVIVDLLKQAYQQLDVNKIPLSEATLSGRTDAVDRYLSAQPLSKTNRSEYEMAIAHAVRLGSCELTQQLLEAGLDVETRSKDHTLLMIACETGSEPIVDLLLSRKADPNAQVKAHGLTALMIAAGQKNVKILEKLVAAGADHRRKDQLNRSARDFASHKKVQAYLDTLASSANHATLHESIAGNSVSSVRQFISAGAPLDTVDAEGKTPILLALHVGNPLVIQLLVEAGASLDHQEVWRHALSERSGKQVAEVVAQLIGYGVDVNLRETLGLPPLFRANDPAVMQLLLKAGANPHAVFVEPVDFQAIKFQAITLSIANNQSLKKKGSGTIADDIQDVEVGMEIMHKQMAVAEFFKDKDAAYFENPNNRTEQNAQYFDLYAPAKVEATKSVQRLSVIDYHKMWGNRKAIQFMRDYLGMTRDAYDLAMTEIKEFGKNGDDAFLAEANRLGAILQAKAVPWKKRKGVLHFTAALHKTLPEYFNTVGESQQLTPGDHDYGFEKALLSRLQAEVRANGYTLIWTEKHWNQRPLTRLILIPSNNDLTAIAICGTNRNTREDSREVVNWCDQLRKKFPFQIAGASFDSMELDFHQPIGSSLDLAREIATFCPDVEVPLTDEAALAELAQELQSTGRCFFWWD